jgi:nucleoside-diphosphate-sugar epimerase
MSAARTAVIGGAGFIGSALSERLRQAGEPLRIISRSAASAPPGGAMERVAASVGDRDAIRAALQGCRRVYCLATGGDGTWEGFERDFIAGARHVAEACLEHGVERLVYCSSIAALYLGGRGRANAETPPDPHPDKRAFYARAKILAERELTKLRRERGLPLVIVRPGVVLGRGGMLNHSGLGLWMSDLDCVGWGMGRNPLPLVLVDDVADALVRAMETPGVEGKALNLAGDVRLDAREMIAEMRRRSRRRFRFHPRPLWWLQGGEILKWAVKALARKAGNTFPSWRDLKSRSLRCELDCSREKQILGWQPVSSREAFLAQAIDANLPALSPWDLRQAEDPCVPL